MDVNGQIPLATYQPAMVKRGPPSVICKECGQRGHDLGDSCPNRQWLQPGKYFLTEDHKLPPERLPFAHTRLKLHWETILGPKPDRRTSSSNQDWITYSKKKWAMMHYMRRKTSLRRPTTSEKEILHKFKQHHFDAMSQTASLALNANNNSRQEMQDSLQKSILRCDTNIAMHALELENKRYLQSCKRAYEHVFSNPKARFRRTIPLKDNKETQPANVNIATYNPLEGLEEEYDTEYEDIPEYEEKCTQFTWKQISDPSYVCTMAQIGRPYYWHAITRQSKWECPKVFVRARYPHDYQPSNPLPKSTYKQRKQNFTRQVPSSQKRKYKKRKRKFGSDDESEDEFGMSGVYYDYQSPMAQTLNGEGEALRRAHVRKVRMQRADKGQERALIDAGLRVIQRVIQHRRRDGSKMSEYFMELPEKEDYPDYYTIVDRPISIKDIRRSLRSGIYVTLDDLRQDFELLFDNARTYNESDSIVCKDAKGLEVQLNAALEEEDNKKDETVEVNTEKSASKKAKKANSKNICGVCGSSDDIANDPGLVCDRCEDSYHLSCLKLNTVPEDDWLCYGCRSRHTERYKKMTPQAALEEKRISEKQSKAFYEAELLHDYDLANDPAFAEVCSFWMLFGNALRMPDLDQDSFQEALMKYSSKKRQLLTNVHVKLLRGMHYTFQEDDWERQLMKFANNEKQLCPTEFEALQEVGYYYLPPSLKLSLIRHLMLSQFESNERLRKWLQTEVKDQGSFAFHFIPIGMDQDGIEYWLISDHHGSIRAYSLPKSIYHSADDVESCPDSTNGVSITPFDEVSPTPDSEIKTPKNGSPAPQSRKRKRNTGNNISLPDALKQILENLEEAKTRVGRVYSEVFMDLPSAEDYPDYYEIIKTPMTINMMRDKSTKYTSIDELRTDIDQMVTNAKTYNQKGSIVCKDADAMKRIFERHAKKLEKDLDTKEQKEPEPEPESTPCSPIPMSIAKVGHDLISKLKNSCTEEGDSICLAFEELPNKEEYPSYYEYIKKPISLQEMETKLDSDEGYTLSDLDSDMKLMVENAKYFNVEGSEVWNNADAIEKKWGTEYAKVHSTPNEHRSKRRRISKNFDFEAKKPGVSTPTPSLQVSLSRPTTGRKRGKNKELKLKIKVEEKPFYQPEGAAAGPCSQILDKLSHSSDINILKKVVDSGGKEKNVLWKDIVRKVNTHYQTLSHLRFDMENLVELAKAQLSKSQGIKVDIIMDKFRALYKEAEVKHPHLRFAVEEVVEMDSPVNEEAIRALRNLRPSMYKPYYQPGSCYGSTAQHLGSQTERKKEVLKKCNQVDPNWKCVAHSEKDVISLIDKLTEEKRERLEGNGCGICGKKGTSASMHKCNLCGGRDHKRCLPLEYRSNTAEDWVCPGCRHTKLIAALQEALEDNEENENEKDETYDPTHPD
eukprot:m.254189 g.254189  ORF g.254189 m.254189 type:complete len:1411 (-) comp16168_c0_seq6:905-5137(-)